jgi:hypothetical protein
LRRPNRGGGGEIPASCSPYNSSSTKRRTYDGSKVKTLSNIGHIRLRTGAHYDDGCYILLKEVIDNAIDEYIMGFGKHEPRFLILAYCTGKPRPKRRVAVATARLCGLQLFSPDSCSSVPGWFFAVLSGMDLNKQPGGIHGGVRRNSLSPSEGERIRRIPIRALNP